MGLLNSFLMSEKTMRKRLTPLMLLAGLSLSLGAQAAPININGNLADWGVKRNGNVNDWTPNPALNLVEGIQYKVEDQTGGLGVYLGPGYGGQAYDAEAMYALVEGGMLFIALATGHAPNTPNNPGANIYGAGDFAIDFGKDGSYEVGINVKPGWDAFGVAGGVYKVSAWAYGLWNDNRIPGYRKLEHPTSIVHGAYLGMANLAISGPETGFGAFKNDRHYFYEVGLGLDLLRNAGWKGESFNIHWTQNCANDYILVDPPGQVHEPATLALLPFGLLGLMAMRRRGSS